ncbi:hypothetical protein Q5P01_000713 [Channa striata]|uniref:Uncharacterized protein n=1 Tax=Channa striata TaxID=64152 RepID=A0AA88IIE1_CHASR|nr:hypothetical protein Q5P01_000713 [Channa striata]
MTSATLPARAPGVKSVSPRAGAGRAVCAEGKRRGAGRPAWAQPRTKEEEERLQGAQGQPDGGRPPAQAPRAARATDADGAAREAQATEAGRARFAGERGRGASPTPSAPVGFDKACRRQGLPPVYRPSQTPHLPLSPERVTPGGAGRLTPEARARSGLASPPHRRLFTLETCCGYGYGLARDLHLLPRIFKGQRELTDAAGTRRFQGTGPSLGRTHSRAPCPSQRKENSPGAPASFSGIVCVTALGASRRLSPPLQIRGSEPDSLFDRRGGVGHRPTLRTAFAHLLGPTDPCSTAVHMEPFSTGLQSSRLNICYYHQDLHPAAPPGPRPRLPCSPRRPSYSSRRSPRGSCCGGGVWARRSSAIHFQG